MQVPHCQPGVWPTDIPPARFAAHIQQALPTGCRVALLGLPDDLGVRLNGGRLGAAEGPTAFRAALARYGVAEPADTALPRIFDAGDVMPATGDDAATLAQTHRRVSDASASLVRAGLFPIAIGGGHDLTFAFVRGVWEAHRERGDPGSGWHGTYFDAHLDVRDTVGSGMPFRRLVEEGIASSLTIVGMNPLVNSREHAAWFREHGGREAAASDLAMDVSNSHARATGTFASFDMDVLDQSIAPGVSAMNPDGLTVGMAAKALLGITRISSLRCLDFMELCPPHDDRGRTARVAAHLFLIALSGLMQGPLAQERSP